MNLTHNDFGELLPLASKSTKAAKRERDERAIFRLFTLGVVTNRDDWVYGESAAKVEAKVRHLIDVYERERSMPSKAGSSAIKWTRAVKRDLAAKVAYDYTDGLVTSASYRPFIRRWLYSSRRLNEMVYRTPEIFGDGTAIARCIVVSDPTAQKPWMALAVDRLPDLHFVGAAAGSLCFAATTIGASGERRDNITDWALKQFTSHYKAGPGKRLPEPTKEGIFHYVYAVLHDPVYREKYAQNLKREFPRIPLYGALRADFWRWADWGRALMDLHIGYESVEPWPLKRTDTPDEKARAAGQAPKCILKSDPDAGRIVIDSETVLAGVPGEAWNYRLGNRSAIDWVLDQHKERKPKDPTIRAKFDTYRFTDHKERVIDLLARVVRVSVETLRIVEAIRAAPR